MHHAPLLSTRAIVCAMLPLLAVFAYACGDDPVPEAASSDAGTVDVTAPDVTSDGGGPASTRTLWKSGTRLRAEVERAADATRFARFVDSERNEHCSFRMTSAGLRCIPSAEAVMFDDAACQVPIAITVTTCAEEPPDAYAVRDVESKDPCEPEIVVDEIFSVAGPIAPRAGFQRLGDGSCAPRPVLALSYRGIGPAVPLSAFVGAKVTREDVSPAIARGRIIGDDGSELVDGNLYDRTREGRQCERQRVGGGPEEQRPFVCATARTAFANDEAPLYGEPGCATARVATSFTPPSCPKPDLVARAQVIDAGSAPSCVPSGSLAFHAAGAETTPLFTLAGGTCEPYTAVAGERGFALGSPIDTTTLPALTRTLVGSTGRIRLDPLTNAGAVVERAPFWDDQEKSICFVTSFSDGKRYCVPATTVQNDKTFKDASCQEPIVIGSDCALPPTFVVEQAKTSCFTFQAMGWSVGTTKIPSGSMYWRRVNETTCAGPSAIGPTFYAFDILAPAAASTKLVEVTRVRE